MVNSSFSDGVLHTQSHDKGEREIHLLPIHHVTRQSALYNKKRSSFKDIPRNSHIQMDMQKCKNMQFRHSLSFHQTCPQTVSRELMFATQQFLLLGNWKRSLHLSKSLLSMCS